MDDVATLELEEESQILDEVELQFVENSEIGAGTCSCVCINDEQCCGCLIQ